MLQLFFQLNIKYRKKSFIQIYVEDGTFLGVKYYA